MKIKAEVEIDWLEEGANVDAEIQGQIINKVAAEICKNLKTTMIEMAQTKIAARVDEMTTELWSSFIERPAVITDRYGDPVESHNSIKDMLKARLDSFIDQKVDGNGKPLTSGQCGYSSKTMAQYLIDKHADTKITEFVASLQKVFDAQLKEKLTDKLKQSVASSMLQNVDLSKALK